jgi:hypothetical protein
MTFSGFKSRWITPCACAKATAAQPLLAEEGVGVRRGAEALPAQLAVGRLEIERDEPGVAAALLAGRSAVLLRGERVHADAQERAKPGPSRVELLEKALLQRPREKALGQVLGVFVAEAALDAEVFVDGLPVRRDQRVEGLLPDGRVGTAGRADQRAARGRERGRRAAEIGVAVHWDWLLSGRPTGQARLPLEHAPRPDCRGHYTMSPVCQCKLVCAVAKRGKVRCPHECHDSDNDAACGANHDPLAGVLAGHLPALVRQPSSPASQR